MVADPLADLRDIGHAGEHLLVYPSADSLAPFLARLMDDPAAGLRIRERGWEIVAHLHTPAIRAHKLHDILWPKAKVLGATCSAPAISVLTCCYKYLQRFRVYMDALARQDLPANSLEIVVADPESPDGLAGYLVDFAAANPHLRVIHVPVKARFCRNRGLLINRAFHASKGRTIISTDGDIVFPPHLIGLLAQAVNAHPRRAFGVRRHFLNKEATLAVLSKSTDPVADFLALLQTPGDCEPDGKEGVLGYCQAVAREAFAKAGYPEEFDRINQSDIVFLERLNAYAGVTPHLLETQAVLHLWHPRDWSGAKEFL